MRKKGPALKKLLGEYDSQLFWLTLLLTCVIVGWGLIDPRQFNAAMATSQSWVTDTFGWFFLLTVASMIVFSVWLSVSKYGDIVL